ncbi:hypothetical protein STCU_05199 [Strigomonas culicis]|uniref:Uncharacterized protein n=1 Tax=Strigomonas culicis TaxID=28005 RepID=S9UH88_9TRYP|nr:hypothetical protein STCU_07306 [Strigomonas culicis]EPY28303.1 hypothetical protein STCU_05199 [Strigomonas culicis]|eukprot:EPY24187.1 hypothetical protein STCU_07306 [Strigomonas culicis]
MKRGSLRDQFNEAQVLPSYITDRREKVRTVVEQNSTGPYRSLSVAVEQLKGHVALLRESCDVVEGSVLALGVPTAHRLITNLSEVRETLEQLQVLWLGAQAASRGTNRLWEELYDSLGDAFHSLRQRNEALERETQQVLRGEDRREATVDRAIQYVLAVVAERAQWQEAHRHNPQQLPLDEASFAERTKGALDALYALRPAGDGGGLPIAKVGVNRVDDSDAIGKRWGSAENTRHALLTPSSRLHYVPPAEEVALLRDVLRLGTGSTTLMKDIQMERARLLDVQEAVRAQCAASKAAVRNTRQELSTLRHFLRHCLDTKAPFANNKDQLLKMLDERVAEEVRSRLALQQAQWVHQQQQFRAGANSFDPAMQASRLSSSTSSDDRTPPLIEEEIEQLRQWNKGKDTGKFIFPRDSTV